MQDPRTWDPLRVIAATIWGEARGESKEGKTAVAFVIWNRAKKNKIVNDDVLVDVCLKPKQFSCWNSGIEKLEAPLKYDSAEIWEECFNLALMLSIGWFEYFPDPTHGADHYHEKSIHPKWADKMTKTAEIGNHIFYRS